MLRSWRTLAVIALVASAAGCASEPFGAGATATRHAGGAAWEAEFADAKADASPYETKVLADDEVTESELSDSHARMVRCMSDSGFNLVWSEEDTYEVTNSSGADLSAAVDARLEKVRVSCLEHWDRSITYLFTETRRNPEKQDEAKITVACLRRSGLVGADYSERKWRSENDTGNFSFDDYDSAAAQCRRDPLGLGQDQ